MADAANINLEKLFFTKIFNEPEQYYKVKPQFFINEQIRIIYDVLRENYINSDDKVTPSPKQVWAMVSLVDVEKKISKDSLKSLLNVDLSEYDDSWIKPRFNAWKVSKHTREELKDSIDLIQNMDEIDLDNVMSIAKRLKDRFADIDSMGSDDDSDLGDDFDDPEMHKQLVAEKKMSSGWANVDKILTGGWDHATLNLIMGETNVGKCFLGASIRVKNKKTGIIQSMKIEDFYAMVKKESLDSKK